MKLYNKMMINLTEGNNIEAYKNYEIQLNWGFWIAGLIEQTIGKEYSSIIGVDCSGRLPAIIYWKARRKIDHSKKMPLYFLASPTEHKATLEDLSRVLNQKNKLGNRLLIIDNSTFTGYQLGRIVTLLNPLKATIETAVLIWDDATKGEAELREKLISEGERCINPDYWGYYFDYNLYKKDEKLAPMWKYWHLDPLVKKDNRNLVAKLNNVAEEANRGRILRRQLGRDFVDNILQIYYQGIWSKNKGRVFILKSHENPRDIELEIEKLFGIKFNLL